MERTISRAALRVSATQTVEPVISALVSAATVARPDERSILLDHAADEAMTIAAELRRDASIAREARS